MTTPGHGLYGGLMAFGCLKLLSVFVPIGLAFLSFPDLFWAIIIEQTIESMLPDLIGAYGTIIRRDDWALYDRAHSGDIARRFEWSALYQLHLWVDQHFHKPTGGWKLGIWKVEVIIDIALLLIVFLII